MNRNGYADVTRGDPKLKPPTKAAKKRTQKANQDAMKERTLEKLNEAYERARG